MRIALSLQVGVVTACVSVGALGYPNLGVFSPRTPERQRMSSDVTLSIAVTESQWRPRRMTEIAVQLFNGSTKDVGVIGTPALSLESRSALDQQRARARHWAPVDLRSGGHLAREQAVSLTIRSGGRHQLKITSPMSLLWAPEQSAVWPMQPLETIVKPGKYDLTLRLDIFNGTEERRLLSNNVEVHVDR
jgi:hypothetical protein